MKSNYCERYLHKPCQRFRHLHMECDCACHQAAVNDDPIASNVLPNSEWHSDVQGNIRLGPTPENEPQPPPQAGSFDHRLYLLAWDTGDPREPWLHDMCVMCYRSPIWTHNKRDVERHEVICEDCGILMQEELTEKRVQRENRTAKSWNDPFSNQ